MTDRQTPASAVQGIRAYRPDMRHIDDPDRPIVLDFGGFASADLTPTETLTIAAQLVAVASQEGGIISE